MFNKDELHDLKYAMESIIASQTRLMDAEKQEGAPAHIIENRELYLDRYRNLLAKVSSCHSIASIAARNLASLG